MLVNLRRHDALKEHTESSKYFLEKLMNTLILPNVAFVKFEAFFEVKIYMVSTGAYYVWILNTTYFENSRYKILKI